MCPPIARSLSSLARSPIIGASGKGQVEVEPMQEYFPPGVGDLQRSARSDARPVRRWRSLARNDPPSPTKNMAGAIHAAVTSARKIPPIVSHTDQRPTQL